jgi:L-rhamnose mutarotase
LVGGTLEAVFATVQAEQAAKAAAAAARAERDARWWAWCQQIIREAEGRAEHLKCCGGCWGLVLWN